jgi:hypothetical protein
VTYKIQFLLKRILFKIFQNDDFLPHTKLKNFGLLGYYKITVFFLIPALPTLPSWDWRCCGFPPSNFQVFFSSISSAKCFNRNKSAISSVLLPQEEYYCTLSFSYRLPFWRKRVGQTDRLMDRRTFGLHV